MPLTQEQWIKQLLGTPTVPPFLCCSCGSQITPRGIGICSRNLFGADAQSIRNLADMLQEWCSYNRNRVTGTDAYILYDLQKYLCGTCYDQHMVGVFNAFNPGKEISCQNQSINPIVCTEKPVPTSGNTSDQPLIQSSGPG